MRFLNTDLWKKYKAVVPQHGLSHVNTALVAKSCCESAAAVIRVCGIILPCYIRVCYVAYEQFTLEHQAFCMSRM
jgi:hypothetical protein